MNTETHSARTSHRPLLGSIARLTAGTAGIAALGYGATTAFLWARYGHPPRARVHERDCMLDQLMPHYDVVERHRIDINAPAPTTLEAAGEQDLMSNPIVRTIFAARAMVLGSERDTAALPNQLLPMVRSIGWRVLAEAHGREIVVGAVTKPWEPNVTFRGLDPDAFVAFHEPGYVKIIWSLRADPVGPDRSVFRTETRAIATDDASRARFRWYWAFAAPGVWLIRRASLRPLKFKAEHRAHRGQRTTGMP